jgi:outer membrane protein assembly complex protein YaeT
MLFRLFLMAILFLTEARRAVAASHPQFDPAIHYQTASISIVGNHKFSNDDLLAVMQTRTRPAYELWKRRPGFSLMTFEADVDRMRRFYQVRGYYSAAVEYDLVVKGELVRATIHIEEGQPVVVKGIRIAVKGMMPQPKALDPGFELLLTDGEVFTQNAYELADRQLLDVFMRHGYAHAQVNRRAKVLVASRQAYVWYEVIPGNYGVFGATVVHGTREVSPNLILRELTYQPGDVFDSAKVAASRSKIVGLNLFRSVEFIPAKDTSNPHIVPMEVRVQEKAKHSLSLGIGYNTESQFNVGFDWKDYNFMGGGRQLSSMVQYSNVVSVADVKLLQPYFLSPVSTFVAEAKAWQEVYQTYTLNAGRIEPRETYQFLPNLTAHFGWQLGYLRFNSLNPQTIEAIGGVRPQGILSGPFTQLIWNNTENTLNPQRGEIATLSANTATHAFGSDYRYWRALGEVRKYQLLGWQTVLAARAKLGFEHSYGSIGDIPLSERFYSGGEGSVRGYGLRRIGQLSAANEPLGGVSLVESSIELRRALFGRMTGSLFFDCGQVSTHEYRVPIDALQCGYGPAIGAITPVGPTLLDLGFPTETPRGDSHWQVYFSIGQWF